MSQYTRYAQTDEQEASIHTVERWLKSFNKQIWGGTTIGQSPQTVILDLTHHGSEIYINPNGGIKFLNEPVRSFQDFKTIYSRIDFRKVR